MSDFPARFRAATERLQSGYDPEQENGAPWRSDAWCRALGWCDALAEEAHSARRSPASASDLHK